MSDNTPHSHRQTAGCVQFEPLVSALIDGELNESEARTVVSHLQHCPACRQLKQSFEKISSSMVSHQAGLGTSTETVLDSAVSLNSETGTKHALKPRSKPANRFPLFRVIPAAIAASLLILAAISMVPEETNSADASLVENIVEPLADFHMINQQKQRDHQLMLKTMELELRSLRLELDQIDPNVATRNVLAKQIEDMMHKVSHFDASSDL